MLVGFSILARRNVCQCTAPFSLPAGRICKIRQASHGEIHRRRIRFPSNPPAFSTFQDRFDGRISCKKARQTRVLPCVKAAAFVFAHTVYPQVIHRRLSTLSTMLSTYCGFFRFWDVYKFIFGVGSSEYACKYIQNVNVSLRGVLSSMVIFYPWIPSFSAVRVRYACITSHGNFWRFLYGSCFTKTKTSLAGSRIHPVITLVNPPALLFFQKKRSAFFTSPAGKPARPAR